MPADPPPHLLGALLLAAGCASADKPADSSFVPTDPGRADTGAAPPEAAPTPVELPTQDALGVRESVAACASAGALSPHEVLCVESGEVWLYDDSAASPRWLAAGQHVSAVSWAGRRLASIDGVVHSITEDGATPWELSLPVPIETLAVTGSTLWLHGAGRLFYVDGAAVEEVQVEGHAVVSAFAASADTLVVATPELWAIDRSTGPTVLSADSAGATHLAFDHNGALWVRRPDGTV